METEKQAAMNTHEHWDELLRRQYSEFLSRTSHDLLAPLRKLGVLADRLTQKCADQGGGDLKEYTDRIHTCIEEMRSIVKSCRDIAEATRENMEMEDVDLNEILREEFRKKKQSFPDRELSLSAGELPTIQGDGDQLRMALAELIQNAIIFSKPALPVKMSVIAEDSQAGDDRIPEAWKIVFRDNGIGFKVEESELVFEPTVRLHGKSAFPGNGLGLTLVKKIVDNHGGRIRAESNEDGTEFILILPKTKI